MENAKINKLFSFLLSFLLMITIVPANIFANELSISQNIPETMIINETKEISFEISTSNPKYYSGNLMIRFDNTNNDQSLLLTNFRLGDTQLSATEIKGDNEEFLGYDIPLEIKDNNPVILTASLSSTKVNEYHIESSFNEFKSSLNILNIKEENKVQVNEEPINKTTTEEIAPNVEEVLDEGIVDVLDLVLNTKTGKKYPDLISAMNEINDWDTLKLLGDVNVNKTLHINSNLTIDPNNHTINFSLNSHSDFGIVIAPNYNFYLQDSNVDNIYNTKSYGKVIFNN